MYYNQNKKIAAFVWDKRCDVTSRICNNDKRHQILYTYIIHYHYMIRDVKPFDDRQWAQLQKDMKKPLTKKQKEKIAKMQDGVLEISRLVDFKP